MKKLSIFVAVLIIGVLFYLMVEKKSDDLDLQSENQVSKKQMVKRKKESSDSSFNRPPSTSKKRNIEAGRPLAKVEESVEFKEQFEGVVAKINLGLEQCAKSMEDLKGQGVINQTFKLNKIQDLSLVLDSLTENKCSSTVGGELEKLLLKGVINEKNFEWYRKKLEGMKTGDGVFAKFNLIKSAIGALGKNPQRNQPEQKKLTKFVKKEIENSSNLLNLMMGVDYLVEMANVNLIPEESRNDIINLKEEMEESLNNFKEEVVEGQNMNPGEKIDYQIFRDVLLKELRFKKRLKQKVLEVSHEIGT